MEDPELLPEYEDEQVIELPERRALSVVSTNIALPIDPAVAGNVLSDGSATGAGSLQEAPIDQSGLPPA